jgi:hypothetical protein
MKKRFLIRLPCSVLAFVSAFTLSIAAPNAHPTPPAGSTVNIAQAALAQAMDPRGRVAGVADFACPRPRTAGNRFGYGIQSNWPVGDIGYWNTVMASQLKLNWTRAKVNWYEFEPAQGQQNSNQFQLLDAFVADANRKGLNIVATITQPPQWTRVTPPRNAGQRPSPPENVGEGVRFFQLIAARYKGCIQAVEVLNETNLEREWRLLRVSCALPTMCRFCGL